MEPRKSAERVLITDTLEEKLRCREFIADKYPGDVPGTSTASGGLPVVFWFNPLVEGRIALGKSFTPVKHLAALARDLASLPQFLCQRDDVVLVEQRPSAEFLSGLHQAGFEQPEFVKLVSPPTSLVGSLSHHKLGGLRPWAWGPDSIELFEPLFPLITVPHPASKQCFNPTVATLYSKSWSAGLLRKFLSGRSQEPWLCSLDEVGMTVCCVDEALQAVAAIRSRGHHKIVAKEAVGSAGRNAIRLLEPELMESQRRWLTHVLESGRDVIIEPWLEREADFSMQLEMLPTGLKLLGYTGLINDFRGQYLGNWADSNYSKRIPEAVTRYFLEPVNGVDRIHELFAEMVLVLETELSRLGYSGPVGIDSFVYLTPQGQHRIKPIVELNPRYTMGRLTVELMSHVEPGSHGLFRLVTPGQVKAEAFDGFPAYAKALEKSFPLRMSGNPIAKLSDGAVVLTDSAQAQVCMTIFRTSRGMDDLLRGLLLPA